jgi:hypothetical protein
MTNQYSQTQLANLGQPSKFEVVDVGSNGDYTRADGRAFTIQSTGDGGDITVVGSNDTAAVLLPSTPEGVPYPGTFKEIKASGTSPNNIVIGFYEG